MVRPSHAGRRSLFFLDDGCMAWSCGPTLASGTAFLKDINGAGARLRLSVDLKPAGDTLFFVADDGISGGS
jgi:hypothetical protein